MSTTPKLSDTQLNMLATAARRPEVLVVPEENIAFDGAQILG